MYFRVLLKLAYLRVLKQKLQDQENGWIYAETDQHNYYYNNFKYLKLKLKFLPAVWIDQNMTTLIILHNTFSILVNKGNIVTV